ncbi:hypothetical protein ACEPPN_013855 [Leptodophora sp. 'Broadleaf-Isolate-01']
MKEAINHVGPKVEIGESSIPEPKDDQILIKAIASDTNLKDWKVTEFAAILRSKYCNQAFAIKLA